MFMVTLSTCIFALNYKIVKIVCTISRHDSIIHFKSKFNSPSPMFGQQNCKTHFSCRLCRVLMEQDMEIDRCVCYGSEY